MSTIQRAEIKHGEKKKTRIPERTKLPAKKGPSIPVRGKKEQVLMFNNNLYNFLFKSNLKLHVFPDIWSS